MTKLIFTQFLLALLLTPVAASNVVELTSANFEHQTQASTGMTTGKWFVKFYAPWCGHCKTLAPIWDTLADIVATAGNAAKVESDAALTDFVIAKVDCTEERDVCNRFEVRGFPTLKLFANHQAYSYEGGRSVEDMKEYLKSGTSDGKFGGTTGSAIPVPPSWMEQKMKEIKFLKGLSEDFNHIVSYRKNAAAILVGMGFVWGILILSVLRMVFGGSSSKAKKD